MYDARSPLLEVVDTGRRVPVFGGSFVEAINLDNAATTPALRRAWESVAAVQPWYGSVHRGAGYQSVVSTQLLECARDAVLAFSGARSDEEVLVLSHNATASINVLARRVAQLYGRTRVVTSAFEHSSNLLPWRRWGEVSNCRADSFGEWDLEHLVELLRTTRAKVVAVTAASNVTGRVVDVDSIAAVAHEHGAVVAVDASQYVAHRPLVRGNRDSDTRWDFVVFSGHKMYAPFGAGVLVGPKIFFEKGWPDRPGGGTVRLIDGDEVVWADLPDREDGGTPNYFGLIALAEACTALKEVGFETIRRHEAALSVHARNLLSDIRDVVVHRPFNDNDPNWLAVFPFSVARYHHGIVAAYLGIEKGIAVRSGHLCQYELVRQLTRTSDDQRRKILGEVRGGNLKNISGVVRASAGLSSTTADLDALGEALSQLVEAGPAGKYVQGEDGRFRNVDWTAPLPPELQFSWAQS